MQNVVRNLTRTLTRKSPSQGESTLLSSTSNSHWQAQGVIPRPGMSGVLYFNGLRLIVDYKEPLHNMHLQPKRGDKEVSYQYPMPPLEIGNLIPIFILGKPLSAIIKQIDPHLHPPSSSGPSSTLTHRSLAETAPRIVTRTFDNETGDIITAILTPPHENVGLPRERPLTTAREEPGRPDVGTSFHLLSYHKHLDASTDGSRVMLYHNDESIAEEANIRQLYYPNSVGDGDNDPIGKSSSQHIDEERALTQARLKILEADSKKMDKFTSANPHRSFPPLTLTTQPPYHPIGHTHRDSASAISPSSRRNTGRSSLEYVDPPTRGMSTTSAEEASLPLPLHPEAASATLQRRDTNRSPRRSTAENSNSRSRWRQTFTQNRPPATSSSNNTSRSGPTFPPISSASVNRASSTSTNRGIRRTSNLPEIIVDDNSSWNRAFGPYRMERAPTPPSASGADLSSYIPPPPPQGRALQRNSSAGTGSTANARSPGQSRVPPFSVSPGGAGTSRTSQIRPRQRNISTTTTMTTGGSTRLSRQTSRNLSKLKPLPLLPESIHNGNNARHNGNSKTAESSGSARSHSQRQQPRRHHEPRRESRSEGSRHTRLIRVSSDPSMRRGTFGQPMKPSDADNPFTPDNYRPTPRAVEQVDKGTGRVGPRRVTPMPSFSARQEPGPVSSPSVTSTSLIPPAIATSTSESTLTSATTLDGYRTAPSMPDIDDDEDDDHLSSDKASEVDTTRHTTGSWAIRPGSVDANGHERAAIMSGNARVFVSYPTGPTAAVGADVSNASRAVSHVDGRPCPQPKPRPF